QDAATSQPTAEVAHEVLLRSWPRVQQWLTDYRPFVHWYENDLAPFLHHWLAQKQHPDFLLPESMLSQAQHWAKQYPDELSGPPAAYIQASVDKQVHEHAARERLQRRITAGLVAGL